MKLQEKLNKIQQELKAHKSQHNEFGNYDYRSCEDILAAVKKLLDGCILILTDEIVNFNERYYLKSTATIKDAEESISTCGYAREPASRKGMDESQITGASSSYARKYALNGLFCIDDTKDADSMEPPEHTEHKGNQATDKVKPVSAGTITVPQQKRLFAILKGSELPVDLFQVWLKEQYTYDKTEDIKKGPEYEAIIKHIENYKKEDGDCPF